MTSADPFLTPEVTRAQVAADLAVIDAALDRLRSVSTDLVGNGFRVTVAERLERHRRVVLGLSYRMFGEIIDPPDGPHDPNVPMGCKIRDVLSRRLRITAAEVTRRAKLAGRIRTRRTITGEPVAPELPALAEAIAAGDLGEDHVREILTALRLLPNAAAAHRERAERTLVRHARVQDASFVAEVGRKLADTLNPDGVFDDRDRANRRGVTMGPQGADGMSRLSGWLTPEGRAHLETVGAAVRPGHHLPGLGAKVVDAVSDTRSDAQRLHDAIVWGLQAGIASGELGTHRGIPVTIIVTTTLAELDQAARATVDPSVPMPGPARTGGGSRLPMRDLIAMAGNGIHYLAVFDDHSDRPLYLGRSTRIASLDQRIICHGRDKGCTRPGCAVPGYRCEVMHSPDWNLGGATDADTLHFGCGPDHALVTRGHASTTVTDDGRLAWTVGDDPPEINHLHHATELLEE